VPHSRALKKLSEVIYDDDAPKGDPVAAAGKTLELFEREIAALENRLSASFKLRRLRARTEIEEDGSEVVYDELLQHLHYCVTGIDQPIRLPAVPMYLDAVIGGQELWGGVTPRIGRKQPDERSKALESARPGIERKSEASCWPKRRKSDPNVALYFFRPVVFRVPVRDAVQVGAVKDRRFSTFIIFCRQTVAFSVHDLMFALDDPADRAQHLRKFHAWIQRRSGRQFRRRTPRDRARCGKISLVRRSTLRAGPLSHLQPGQAAS